MWHLRGAPCFSFYLECLFRSTATMGLGHRCRDKKVNSSFKQAVKSNEIASGCDPTDHRKRGGACAATCIGVLTQCSESNSGGAALPLHPTAPVRPFLRWQPGLCNEERHSNELHNSGGAAPPLHPLTLAFARSLSYQTVSEAVCHVQRAIHGGCIPSELLLCNHSGLCNLQ